MEILCRGVQSPTSGKLLLFVYWVQSYLGKTMPVYRPTAVHSNAVCHSEVVVSGAILSCGNTCA